MRYKFDEQLAELNEEMLKMGNSIMESIKAAIDALVNRDVDKAKMIMDNDANIDRMQKKIEHICLNLLIQQQPVAKDLRTITAAMKMVTDMERIGDHAADISEMTVSMGKNSNAGNFDYICKMASEIMIMLNHSMEAYIQKNAMMANEVIEHDDIVDDLFDATRKNVVKLILNNPSEADKATDYLMIAKYFERIGDHTTNIAEWIIYLLGE